MYKCRRIDSWFARNLAVFFRIVADDVKLDFGPVTNFVESDFAHDVHNLLLIGARNDGMYTNIPYLANRVNSARIRFSASHGSAISMNAQRPKPP